MIHQNMQQLLKVYSGHGQTPRKPQKSIAQKIAKIARIVLKNLKGDRHE